MAGPPITLGSLARLSLGARIGVGAIACLLVGVTYWLVFYTAISTKIEGARRQGSQLGADYAEQQQARAGYLADRDELALCQQRQRELNKELPAEAEAASFLSSIQQATNVSGIDLKAWQPLDEKNMSFYAKVPMKLEMTGRFHQIAKFVYEIGKLERIINVENIDLSDPKQDGDEVVLKAKCLATTFHMLKGAPAVAAATAPPGAAPAPPGAAR